MGEYETARAELSSEDIPALLRHHNSWTTSDHQIEEWTKPKEELIDLILDLMVETQEISPPDVETFTLSDLCREHKINAKVARSKLRDFKSDGVAMPESLKKRGWVFNISDRMVIEQLVLPKRRLK